MILFMTKKRLVKVAGEVIREVKLDLELEDRLLRADVNYLKQRDKMLTCSHAYAPDDDKCVRCGKPKPTDEEVFAAGGAERDIKYLVHAISAHEERLAVYDRMFTSSSTPTDLIVARFKQAFVKETACEISPTAERVLRREIDAVIGRFGPRKAGRK